LVVDDRHLVGLQTLDGVGDEIADGVHGLGFEARTGEFDEDRGGRLDALAGEEEPVLGLDDHDAGRAHALELGDGPAELALEGAQVVRALDEVAQAELALVEDLEADAVAGREALGGQVHPQAVNPVGGHVDRAAAGRHLVRDALGLELADDRGGVPVAEAAVEELVVGPARPEHEGAEAGQHAGGGDHERNALVEAELLPEGEQGLREGFHRGSGRGRSITPACASAPGRNR